MEITLLSLHMFLQVSTQHLSSVFIIIDLIYLRPRIDSIHLTTLELIAPLKSGSPELQGQLEYTHLCLLFRTSERKVGFRSHGQCDE